MSLAPQDSFEDESIERHVPKRMRKSFDKRKGPVAARSTIHATTKPASGLHRRRRRHYGL
jgi:hypothetical protein